MTDREKHDQKLIERLSLFNDAVYAIVLTLLILEIHIPELIQENSFSEMFESLKHLYPKFSAFLLTALMIGANWMSSINIQRIVTKINPTYIVTMITYLIIISILPFCGALIGNYPNNPASYVILGILTIVLLINGYIYTNNIIKNKLMHPDSDIPELIKVKKLMPIVVIFIIMMSLLAFVSTLISFILFLIWSVLPFFLTKDLSVVHKK
jgi:uncharacterized membrane protein